MTLYLRLLYQAPCPGGADRKEPWITGFVELGISSVPCVSTDITRTDKWEHLKCQTSSFRNNYTVIPGLYAVGSPCSDSDVIVTANYKYSFDVVRHALKGLNLWILVLDTKGINVWCAAGKGTFGTEELVKQINSTRLTQVVNHKRVIVPQLGAVGVSGYKVSKATGFKVDFGPVHAEDILSFIETGYKAGPEMRTIQFSIMDRLVLTPMEISPAMKKFPLFALIVLFIFGLQPQGIIFKDALPGGLPFLAMGLAAILSGAFLTPILLPFILFRFFAVKGWLAGMATIFVVIRTTAILDDANALLFALTYIFFPLFSSYWALQFTGSTTYTSMTGVKKEMRIAILIYIGSLVVAGILAILYKMDQWGVL